MSSVTPSLDAKRFVEAFKNHLGVDRDLDLAEALGIGKSTIASWRKRGVVPDTIVARAREEFGLTSEYVESFTTTNRENVALFSEIGFYLAVLRLGSVLPEADRLECASRLRRSDREIIERLRQAAETIPEGFASSGLALFRAIDRGELASPEQLKTWLSTMSPDSSAATSVPHAVPQSSE